MDTSPQGVLTEEGSQQSASEGSASWGTRCRDGFAGARLRVMRAAAGRTIASVAADAGLSVPYIANLEDGQGNPTLAALDRLARALGTELTVGLGAPSPQAPVGPSASLVRVARTERLRRIATEFAGPDRSSAEIAAALVDLACARRPDPRHRAHRGRLVASARRIAARRPASDRRLISPELSAAVSLIRSLRLPGSGRVRQGGRGARPLSPVLGTLNAPSRNRSPNPPSRSEQHGRTPSGPTCRSPGQRSALRQVHLDRTGILRGSGQDRGAGHGFEVGLRGLADVAGAVIGRVPPARSGPCSCRI